MPILQSDGLGKVYPGVVALADFDFALARGEVRALLGKNGAGKSTFIEIVSGTILPSSGTLRIGGAPVRLTSPAEARQHGVETVHQDLRLFPDLTVRENIAMGWGARFGVISRRAQADQARAALAQIGAGVPVEARVAGLSGRDRQIVAIARALLHRPRVLILDEPTSSLHAEEIDQLIAVVRRLAAQGVVAIWISHRLDEIPRVADSVTVLRNGRHAGTLPITDAPPGRIVDLMLGQALRATVATPSARHAGRRALQVTGLRTDRLHGIDLHVDAGEVVGLWGMPGAGRTEVMRAVFGLDRPDSGRVQVNGAPLPPGDPTAAIAAGLGLSPEDRKRQGLVQFLSIEENLTMAIPDRIAPFGVLRQARRAAAAGAEIARLGIKVGHPSDPVRTLSGGNQQKVVVGKWLARGSRIFLLDEPTQGVDVEAKAALYAIIKDLARDGAATLIAPTEPQEFQGLCDRVVILRDGAVVAELPGAEATAALVMQRAMGA